MTLTRLLVLALMSISLVGCSGGEDDSQSPEPIASIPETPEPETPEPETPEPEILEPETPEPETPKPRMKENSIFRIGAYFENNHIYLSSSLYFSMMSLLFSSNCWLKVLIMPGV